MSILDQHRRQVVEFNPHDPQHVRQILAVMSGKSVSEFKLSFAYQPPFTSGVTQAIHKMAQAWAEEMTHAKTQPTRRPPPQPSPVLRALVSEHR